MKQLTIKCPVTIKAIVTEKLKKQMAAEMQDAIQKIDMELQQIEFQAKRIMADQVRQDAQRLITIRQQVEAEKQQRIEVKEHLLEQIKNAAQLELGAEVVQGQLEQFVGIDVGDDLHKIMATEIVVKDGKVLEIRQ